LPFRSFNPPVSNSAIESINGKLTVRVLDKDRDRIQVSVTSEKFGFNTKDDQRAMVFYEGANATFEDNGGFLNYKEYVVPSETYNGTIRIENFSGKARFIDNYYYDYEFESINGNAEHVYRYSLKDMNLSGKVSFSGKNYTFETKNLSSLYFNSKDVNDYNFHALITGELLLNDGNATVNYLFNAVDPDTIYTNEITAKVGETVIESFWGVR
jgi:hypothetical protein